MQWHEFIFSEDPKLKTVRHSFFWFAWWLYFLVSYLLLQLPVPKTTMQPGHLLMHHHLLLKTSMLIILYAVACYGMLYILLPQLIERRWLKAISAFIMLISFLMISTHFLYWNLSPLIDSLLGASNTAQTVAWFWPAINLGLLNFIKVGSSAAMIKCVKYWGLKQKETERLEKDKMNAELQLLKAQVHPDFLFNTLNSIHVHAVASSQQTPFMLVKLSDLLSYMLYECDQPLVP